MDAHDAGRRLVSALAVLILAAGCAGSASLTPIPTSTPAPTPSASQPAALRCAETPNAPASATVQWNLPVVGSPTIKAGQAVAFIADAGTPTVTEWGTNGAAVAGPCIDKELRTTPETVVVTFYQPGDYLIGCRKVADMKTVVHVQ
jgi:plastocyanin